MKRLIALLALAMLAPTCADRDSGVPSIGAPAQQEPITVTDGDFNFVAIGDWGSGLQAEMEVADRMCRWRDKHPFDLVVTSGDNIYPSGHPDDFESKFFEPHACLLDAGVKWHAALGNHDIVTNNGQPEINEPAFGMRKRNYVVRKGTVRFVFADSNDLNMGFLRRKLPAEEGDRWTVVAFHHPVYTGGTGHGPTPGFAEKLKDLFRDTGVDLVINGHDHVYSATERIGGVRYVVTGGGGAILKGCRPQPRVVRCEGRYHFLYVTVTDEKLTVYAIPANGAPFHRFATKGN